jgi:phosphatidylserine/phosphatidylglycerophosphate/cardiolipin synthase-like enzyme
VLVGLKADRTTVDLLQEAKGIQQELDLHSQAETKEVAQKEITWELEHSRDTASIEAGVVKFLEWVKSGKLGIRAYPSASLHAKVYIMTFHEEDRDKGRVITGSSNFTQAGLRDNLEFNVELKQRSDYEFSLAKFNELWEQATELKQTFIDTIERKSPYAHFTPYELYLKFLYEYFKDSLNQPDELEESSAGRFQEAALSGRSRARCKADSGGVRRRLPFRCRMARKLDLLQNAHRPRCERFSATMLLPCPVRKPSTRSGSL